MAHVTGHAASPGNTEELVTSAQQILGGRYAQPLDAAMTKGVEAVFPGTAGFQPALECLTSQVQAVETDLWRCLTTTPDFCRFSSIPGGQMSDVALSIAWLTPENFTAHKCLDPSGLPATYSEWLTDAEAAMARFADIGRFPERIVIDAHELARWCVAEGRKVDGAARAAFVAHAHGQRRTSRFKHDLLSAPSLLPWAGNNED
jgi:hypothetical protein